MKQKSGVNRRAVYVVDGNRTPFLKATGFGPFSASDLAVQAGSPLLNRLSIEPESIDELILGCVMPSQDEANIARIVALRLGCGHHVPAYTVARNCASGMQAIDNAYQQIASSRSNLILTGGTEAMSRAPLLFNEQMTIWLSQWMLAKSLSQRAQLLTKFRPGYLAPVIALLRGLTDPIVGLNMGQTAEELAYKFNISREEMDAFAYESHQRLAYAYQHHQLPEITPIIDKTGKVYTQDTGLRKDTTLEKLATLKPFFDKKYGMVTAANSSQVTDGACLLLLASAEAIKKYNLPVLGRIVDVEWAALRPDQMGLGPVHAMAPIMARQNITIDDIDCFEINEAFSAQVIACVRAFEDEKYCQQHLGLINAVGSIPFEKLNQEGGAIALGHPVGASGARIVLHMLKNLAMHNTSYGMASICIGGGQGGAMYLEHVTKVNGNE